MAQRFYSCNATRPGTWSKTPAIVDVLNEEVKDHQRVVHVDAELKANVTGAHWLIIVVVENT